MTIEERDESTSIDLSFEQLKNVLSSMAVIVCGIVTVQRDMHSLKAYSPMAMMDGGSVIVVRESQAGKAHSPIVVSDGGN